MQVLLHSAALAGVKYASVYQRERSPFWYVSYLDAATGRRLHRATVHRVDDPTGRRRAFHEAQQLGKEAAASRSEGATDWAWVEGWLRLAHDGRTLQRYENAWAHLELFLEERKLRSPRALRYDHAHDYMAWRTGQKRRRGTGINHNTALTELRVFTAIMREAVKRRLADANPLLGLGLRRKNVREKPAISPAERAAIEAALARRPRWMRDCFCVAIHQGCRLSETQVPLDQVDLARDTIKFLGKGRKEFTTKLHPAVRQLAEEKLRLGERFLCVLPQMPAKAWHTFFREIGLGHLCFHSTRVTVVTQLARAGVPQGVAQSYVGHASETVHRIYQRLTVQDLGAAVSAIPGTPGIPDGPAPTVRRLRGGRKALRERVSQGRA